MTNVVDMGGLFDLVVPAGGWLQCKWRSELVHTDRLLQMVSKRNERNKVAGLSECGDFKAADGADKLCSIAHDQF